MAPLGGAQVNHLLYADQWNKLTPEQRLAAEHKKGPAVIIAAAGAGKTSTFTTRVAKLVHDGVPPSRILALTFSKEAAAEMRERVAAILGITDPDDLKQTIGTFHSVGYQWLIQTMGHAKLIEEWQSKKVLRDHFKAQGQYDWMEEVSSVLETIAKLKSKAMLPGNEKLVAQVGKEVASAFEAYEEFKAENELVDFEDMVLRPVLILEHNPGLLKAFQERYDYLLVDEAQDTDELQLRFATLLASSHKNVWLCMDPRQMIYEWRGANPKVLQQFNDNFADAKRYDLTWNFRSQPHIIDVANAVQKMLPDKSLKPMVAKREDEGGEVHVYHAMGSQDHGQFHVASVIKQQLNQGRKPSDFAIISRVNATLGHFEMALRRLAIPFVIIGSSSLYNRREVRCLFAFAKLMETGDKDALRDLMLTVRHPWFKYLGREYAAKLFLYSDPVKALGVMDFKDHLGRPRTAQMKAARNALKNLTMVEKVYPRKADLFERIAYLAKTVNLSALIREELAESMGEEAGVAIETAVQERLSVIEQVVGESGQFQTLGEFLVHVNRVIEANKARGKSEGDVVKLMSVHKSKGLEWPTVFFAGASEGICPGQHSENITEENRIFYVAVTRARDNLHILTTPDKESRFLPKYLLGAEAPYA